MHMYMYCGYRSTPALLMHPALMIPLNIRTIDYWEKCLEAIKLSPEVTARKFFELRGTGFNNKSLVIVRSSLRREIT